MSTLGIVAFAGPIAITLGMFFYARWLVRH
jgi:hypothetical protein